jgi:hypothetical protein
MAADDWDVAESGPPDPEDVPDLDGLPGNLDDIPEDVPEALAEDAGQDALRRHVEETMSWQDYNRPVPD